MTAPNLFLTYVTDTQRSTVFYCDLFDIEPTFTSPRYVAFEVRHDSLSGKPCHTPTLPSPHATVSRWRSSSSTRDGRSARWPPAARPPGPL